MRIEPKSFIVGMIAGFICGVLLSWCFIRLHEEDEKRRNKEVSAEIEVRNFANTGLTCYCKPCRCVEGVEIIKGVSNAEK